MLAEMKELSKLIRVDPANFAIIYAGLGDKDQAFEWLDRAYNDRPTTLCRIKSEPRWDPLRSDPRFEKLIHRMGLPE